MSRSRFLVLKLSDLQLPLIMLVVAIAIFSFIMMQNDTTQTFAPDNTYQDGMYIANISFSDASIDVIVNVLDEEITSISLDGFDVAEQTLYQDLHNSLAFVNDYITSTQSLEFPEGSTSMTASTSILMDAVKVALSDNENERFTSTYHTPLLGQITDHSSTADELDSSDDNSQLEIPASDDVSVEVFIPSTEDDSSDKASSTPTQTE